MPESWKDLDRLVSAGRQLVDGVSGARPGSRSGNRGEGRRPAGPAGMPRLDGLGRWVENKLDWILEDEDDWREPWQEARPQPSSQARPRRPRASPGKKGSRNKGSRKNGPKMTLSPCPVGSGSRLLRPNPSPNRNLHLNPSSRAGPCPAPPGAELVAEGPLRKAG